MKKTTMNKVAINGARFIKNLPAPERATINAIAKDIAAFRFGSSVKNFVLSNKAYITAKTSRNGRKKSNMSEKNPSVCNKVAIFYHQLLPFKYFNILSNTDSSVGFDLTIIYINPITTIAAIMVATSSSVIVTPVDFDIYPAA